MRTGPQRIAGEQEAVRRGDIVLDPQLHAPTARIDASLRVLPSEVKPIGQWFPVKFHHAAAEVPGRLVVLRESADQSRRDRVRSIGIGATAGCPRR